jgi:hypothetical protein
VSTRRSRRKAPESVRAKTEHLIHEGKTPEQAYGEAWGMHRAGRLTAKGEYKRVKKSRK